MCIYTLFCSIGHLVRVVTIAWVELLPVPCVCVAMLALKLTLTQTPVALEHTVWMLQSTVLYVRQDTAVLTLQVSYCNKLFVCTALVTFNLLVS